MFSSNTTTSHPQLTTCVNWSVCQCRPPAMLASIKVRGETILSSRKCWAGHFFPMIKIILSREIYFISPCPWSQNVLCTLLYKTLNSQIEKIMILQCWEIKLKKLSRVILTKNQKTKKMFLFYFPLFSSIITRRVLECFLNIGKTLDRLQKHCFEMFTRAQLMNMWNLWETPKKLRALKSDNLKKLSVLPNS